MEHNSKIVILSRVGTWGKGPLNALTAYRELTFRGTEEKMEGEGKRQVLGQEDKRRVKGRESED